MRRAYGRWLVSAIVAVAVLGGSAPGHAAAPPPQPTNIMLLGSLGGPLRQVIASGQRAYVSEGNTLTVFDSSDPDALVPLGSLSFTQAIWDMDVAGSFVYVNNADIALQVVDVSNPRSPRLRGSYPGPIDHFFQLEASGSLVHLIGLQSYYESPDSHDLTYDYYIYTIDVSDPDAPAYRGSVETIAAERFVVQGGTGFVSQGTSLHTYDLSDPQRPALLKKLLLGSEVRDLAVAGDRAYALSAGVLRVIDVADPEHAAQIGELPVNAAAVWAAGDRLYLKTATALRVFDTAVDGMPAVLGDIAQSSVTALDVQGALLAVGSAASGLQLIDASDVGQPVRHTPYPLVPSAGSDLVVRGGLAYIADSRSGLQIVDVSAPAAPRLRGQLSIASGAAGIHLAGNTALLAARSAGIEIVDISAPASPRRVATFAVPGGAHDLEAQGSLAFVAAGTSGLLVYDISAPSAPRQVGRYQTANSRIERVALAGGRAYVFNTSTAQIDILDIRDIANIRRLGQIDTQDSDYSVNGMYVYTWVRQFLSPDQGYAVFTLIHDVRNPAAPQIITAMPPFNGAYYPGVLFSGSLAYAYDGTGVLQVFDSERTTQQSGRVASTPFPCALNDAANVGATVYIVTDCGLHILGVNPAAVPKRYAFLPLVRRR